MTGFQNNQEISTQAAQTTMRLSKIAKSPTALQYRQYIGKEVDNILNFVNYGCSLLDFYVGKCQILEQQPLDQYKMELYQPGKVI